MSHSSAIPHHRQVYPRTRISYCPARCPPLVRRPNNHPNFLCTHPQAEKSRTFIALHKTTAQRTTLSNRGRNRVALLSRCFNAFRKWQTHRTRKHKNPQEHARPTMTSAKTKQPGHHHLGTKHEIDGTVRQTACSAIVRRYSGSERRSTTSAARNLCTPQLSRSYAVILFRLTKPSGARRLGLPVYQQVL